MHSIMTMKQCHLLLTGQSQFSVCEKYCQE